jgi:glycosyltransferase involved in cell wall biosynthesis
LLAASPVYYQAPLYRRLAGDPRLDFTAIFASSEGARPHEGGFGRTVDFGVDPLDGYASVFLRRAHTSSVTSRGGTETSPLALRDPDVVRVVRHGRYEVLWIHGYLFVTHILAATTQRLGRRPLIWREEQTLLHPRPLWKTAVKGAALRALFSRSYALYIGTENRRWFAHYGIPSDRLFFAPYAVDNEALQRRASELRGRTDRIREELRIAQGVPVIVTVGRLIPKKQPLHLLDAFARVRREHECALLVVGTGALEAALRERVRRERIPDVVFAGFRPQSEVAEMYAAADVFALVSRSNETWGLVVNEAMNFGLPVVVSDKVGSATDLVRDGQNGCVVGVDDLDGLVAALSALVGSARLREQYGRASLELIDGWNHDRAAAGVVSAVAAAVGAERWSRTAPGA